MAEPIRPPDELIHVGGGDFHRVGENFVRLFTTLAGLTPRDNVLDMGCGIGRMAIPLMEYLDEDRRYEGFDIVADGIDWCRANITLQRPTFRFSHADIYNSMYNPSGGLPACAYRFPYSDAGFDFAFATSLFTHMLPGDVRHYLSELGRVLRPGGRVFLTFHLLNDAVLARRDQWVERLTFRHRLEHCWVNSVDIPEATVAYDEPDILAWLAAVKLQVHAIHPGHWSGRAGTEYQDIVVAHVAP